MMLNNDVDRKNKGVHKVSGTKIATVTARFEKHLKRENLKSKKHRIYNPGGANYILTTRFAVKWQLNEIRETSS